MTNIFHNSLFDMCIFPCRLFGKASIKDLQTRLALDFVRQITKIHPNNTPPASLLALLQGCSAPRGVTRFWGTEK